VAGSAEMLLPPSPPLPPWGPVGAACGGRRGRGGRLSPGARALALLHLAPNLAAAHWAARSGPAPCERAMASARLPATVRPCRESVEAGGGVGGLQGCRGRADTAKSRDPVALTPLLQQLLLLLLLLGPSGVTSPSTSATELALLGLPMKK
jgi:hypothetical protein